ncbi:MAG: hypothetical protein GY823_07350 [Flavobacteriaceae bacterium]|nr:hypothetical protein [Flavobacteriaceae bacterium]|tara:strand:+ start:15812 stop:16570 length:759 start_codon:yes stop_codon:yes gene_type:complete
MKIKIIRVLWGGNVNHEIPRIPLYPEQEIVYCFDYESFWFIQELGYEAKLVKDTKFDGKKGYNKFGRKLQALDLALQEFGEVLLLDWDCFILKPFDKNFYDSLKEKPIQIPLYIQHKDTKNAVLEMLVKDQSPSLLRELEDLEVGMNKYGWEWEEGVIAPNFGFVYCRDKSFGKKLVDIALEHNLNSVVDEFATLIYVDCTLEEYIEKYVPRVVKGRSDQMIIYDTRIHKLSRKFSKWLDTKVNITNYFEHV